MKILFISHCHGHYGASKSLQSLLLKYDRHEISLALPSNSLRGNTKGEIRAFYGPNVSEIVYFRLPFKYCYMGAPERMNLLVRNFLRNLQYLLNREKIYSFIKERGFDVIHLNAPVLYPLIRPDIPFIVHMRDVMLMDHFKAVVKVLQAKGIIFIDPGTMEPFRGKDLRNIVILNNPFDMTMLESGYDEKVILREYGLSPDNIIFSCIGRIKESKGVKFIVESFLKNKNDRSVLLIFGKGDSGSCYERECREIASNDKRIKFMGEERDIAKVYRICDYIIRGDPWHLIGRTVFEGLYSGCDVILPGCSSDLDRNTDLKKFEGKVHLYSSRNVEELATQINILTDKVKDRIFISNVDEYVNKFDQFIEKVLM